MKRYAIVRKRGITLELVTAYLPSNYSVMWQGKTDWHYFPLTNTWKQVTELVDDCVVIEGQDHYGWTLDKYVIPRLGSGGMRADETDLSHPIMKRIPT